MEEKFVILHRYCTQYWSGKIYLKILSRWRNIARKILGVTFRRTLRYSGHERKQEAQLSPRDRAMTRVS